MACLKSSLAAEYYDPKDGSPINLYMSAHALSARHMARGYPPYPSPLMNYPSGENRTELQGKGYIKWWHFLRGSII